MLQSAMSLSRSENNAIYRPKSYLLLYYCCEGRGRHNENGPKHHESDMAIQRKKHKWRVTEIRKKKEKKKKKKRRRKKDGKKKEKKKKGRGKKSLKNPNCWQLELHPQRFELEIVLSRLPCAHPYNHFAVLGRLNPNRPKCTESVCAEPKLVLPACETEYPR